MLVLASQSTGRLSTLRRAGIEPMVRISEVDEDAVLAQLHERHASLGAPPPSPSEQVQALARAKAHEVAKRLTEEAEQGSTDSHGLSPSPASHPASNQAGERTSKLTTHDLLVVGCDSMLEFQGEVLGKPRDADQARERWMAMRGQSGVLHTGHTVVRLRDGAMTHGVSSTRVFFASPSSEEIEAYIASGEPLWVAGSFTLDGLGGAFIEGIEGDPHGVVGISLPLMRELVAELGVRWTDLWNLDDEPSSSSATIASGEAAGPAHASEAAGTSATIASGGQA